MGGRRAFTLIEVLISIVLLGLIIPALYKSVEVLQQSNKSLYAYLTQSEKEAKAIHTLYLDIASSDGNITINKDTFDRLCLNRTQNSLYGLPSPKVCWAVFKEGHELVRMEGYGYRLPLGEDDQVEADVVMRQLELFDIYWKRGNVVVMIHQTNKDPISFMVQGITKPKPKKIKKKKNRRRGSKKAKPKTPPAKAPKMQKKPTIPEEPNAR